MISERHNGKINNYLVNYPFEVTTASFFQRHNKIAEMCDIVSQATNYTITRHQRSSSLRSDAFNEGLICS